MINNRIHWIDFYKAISIFLIVFGHTILLNMSVIHFLFLFHVPLFFFISGYLEKNKECDAFFYVKKLFTTLIFPYFIWNFFCVFFHLPISVKNLLGIFVGVSLWNGASWFLGVLIMIKCVSLLLKNHKNVSASVLILVFAGLFFLNKRMPFFANLTFMYMPFFFAGMYGKSIVNKFVNLLTGRIWINIILALFGVGLLIICYNYTDIPHTFAVIAFTSRFYLYWITGFIGIFSMLFISLCFNQISSRIIELISISTLFIMCSHYEIISIATSYIVKEYGDIYSVIFTCAYFLCQCACIPIVMRWIPILAGRVGKKS